IIWIWSSAVPQKPRPRSQSKFKLSDATIQSKFEQGLVLHQEGKLEEAERFYGEVIRNKPTHFNALHLLGVVCLQTRRPQQSIALISKAIDLNRNNADAYYNLGLALYELNRLDEALES